MKVIFYIHGCPKKQPFDSNIYNGSAQTYPKVLSKVHTRFFQNEEFALCISRINESTK